MAVDAAQFCMWVQREMIATRWSAEVLRLPHCAREQGKNGVRLFNGQGQQL